MSADRSNFARISDAEARISVDGMGDCYVEKLLGFGVNTRTYQHVLMFSISLAKIHKGIQEIMGCVRD